METVWNRRLRTNGPKRMPTSPACVYSNTNRLGFSEIAMPRTPSRPDYGTNTRRIPASLHLEKRQERLLGEVHPPDLLHPLLPFLLLLQELPLARDVATVALGEDVLAHGRDVLPGDDLAPDGGLDRHLEELPGDDLAQPLRQGAPLRRGAIAVHDERQRVHRLAVHQDVELHQVRLPPARVVIVEPGVAA